MAKKHNWINRLVAVVIVLLMLCAGFIFGTVLSVTADSVGVWDKMHERAYTADE